MGGRGGGGRGGEDGERDEEAERGKTNVDEILVNLVAFLGHGPVHEPEIEVVQAELMECLVQCFRHEFEWLVTGNTRQYT